MNRLTLILIGLLVACASVLIYLGPLAQDETYHAFADTRTIFGIPNFWNVVSNLPFAFVGVLGLIRMRDFASRLLFAGVFLTAFGSAYYHWSPDDTRLVWDRLPMTIVFMSLLAMIASEEFPFARRSLAPLVCVGIASVVWWRLSGDLRVYVLVQFAPMAIIPVLLLSRSWGPKTPQAASTAALWWMILSYALAKVAEALDSGIYSVMPFSGHTLKHLLAAASTWFILRWRRERRA